MKNLLFFLSISMLSLSCIVSLASDNNIIKGIPIRNIGDLHDFAARTQEESLILSTVINRMAIGFLDKKVDLQDKIVDCHDKRIVSLKKNQENQYNHLQKGQKLCLQASSTHHKQIKNINKRIDLQGEKTNLQDEKIQLQDGKINLQDAKIQEQKTSILNLNIGQKKLSRRIGILENDVKKQGIVIKGLTFATTLLAGYIIAKEIAPLFKKELEN